MLKKRYKNKLVAEINVVPYIDVMLVLLIIFMVTAPLLQQGVAVDLPQASAETLPQAAQEPIVVSVDQNGQLFLNIANKPSSPITENDLQLRVRAELSRNKDRKVLVKGDSHVDYGRVMDAMVLIQKSGAPSVGLVTRDDNDDNKGVG